VILIARKCLKRRLIIVSIIVACVMAVTILINAIKTLGPTYQYTNLAIMQTCQHTVLTLQSGKKVGVRPGLLFINGDVRISSLLPKRGVIWPLLLENGDDMKGLIFCMISEVNPRTKRSKEITFRDVKEKLFFGLTKKHFAFSCTLESPSPGMHIGFGLMGEYVIIPKGMNPMRVSLLSGPLVRRKATQVGGDLFDMVEFNIAITNNSNATWTFDYEEAIRVVDDDGSRYALLKPRPGCSQITAAPRERQKLTLQFMTPNAGTSPHLAYYTPLGTASIPSD